MTSRIGTVCHIEMASWQQYEVCVVKFTGLVILLDVLHLADKINPSHNRTIMNTMHLLNHFKYYVSVGSPLQTSSII